MRLGKIDIEIRIGLLEGFLFFFKNAMEASKSKIIEYWKPDQWIWRWTQKIFQKSEGNDTAMNKMGE